MAEHRDPPRDALHTAVLATLVVLDLSVLRDDDGGLLPDPGALVIALLAASWGW